MQPWLKADLLFLLLSLHSGMPMAEVAGFLARDEKEDANGEGATSDDVAEIYGEMVNAALKE
jgi:hypothetical protein